MRISLTFLGQKIELNLEDKFYEFVKNDLDKLQDLKTPTEILSFLLTKEGESFKKEEYLKKILKKISQKTKL